MKNKHAQLKLFTLFSLLLLFCTFESMAQEKLITINVKNVSLKEIFNIIENQTPYRFSYRSVVLDADRNISISAENISVTTVLNQALKDRNLEYSIVSPKTIVISDKQTGNVKSSETKKISGIIKDVNGEPIIGANVKIKGQSIGTITDIDGRFVLDASTDATLQISYIGYASLEMNTGNKKELNIVLKEDTETLDEVVVVGYGSVKKRDLTGAITQVKSENLMATAPTTIQEALRGKAAGVMVAGSGLNESPMIRIRGNRSISASNDPLFVIDGVPVNGGMDVVNPADVASIEVLKDASATAIYGTRGINGVIILKLKTPQQVKEEKNIKKIDDFLKPKGVNRRNARYYISGKEVPASTAYQTSIEQMEVKTGADGILEIYIKPMIFLRGEYE